MALREHEMKNAYIGEWKWFIPWENTLVYCPFQNDIKDYSGNNISTSWWWTLVYENPWVRMSEWISINETTSLSNFTIMCYSKISSTSNRGTIFRRSSITSSWYYWFDVEYNTDGDTDCVRVEVLKYQYSNVWKTAYFWIGVTSWHHFCFVVNWSMWYFYVDWVLKASKNISWWTPYVWNYNLWNSSSLQTVWDYIIESKARTAQEIQDYYNNTKSNYWL